MNTIINTLSSDSFKKYLQNSPVYYNYCQTKAGQLLVFSTNLGVFMASFDLDQLSKNEYNASFQEHIDFSKFLLVGTDFQIKVWKALLEIPNEQTTSYQEIASSINHPNSWRAVANAVANNKIAYFIPCHRVIRKNGQIGGYRWGISKKMEILQAENYLSSNK